MATFDLSAADNALKIWFQDPITDQVIAKSDLLSWFNQNSRVRESDFGKYVEVSDIYADPEGVGARKESGYIPEARDPKFQKAQIYLRSLYGTVQMTKHVMQQMTRGKAAFINWADAELRRLERAVRNDVDRQLFGFGAGHVARVDDASVDVTCGMDSAYGVAGITNAAQLFRVGGSYRFFAGAGATTEHNQSGAVTCSFVNSIDRSTQIVTFDAIANDVVDNDYVIRGDAAGHSGQISSTDQELMGLLGHIDDGNILASYFGVTRSSYSPYQAQVVDGSASPYNGNLTETLLMYLNDECIQYGGGDPDAAITTRGVMRNYFSQLRADRSFNDPRSYTGGARDLNVSLGDKVIKLRAARQAPEGTLFLLDRATLQRLHNVGWEWADETGAIFKQVTDSTGRKDEFWAYGRWFMQTFCKSPQKNGRIDSLNESVA
jgi:hypothetical protein